MTQVSTESIQEFIESAEYSVQRKKKSLWRQLWKSKLGSLGAGIVLFIIILAVFAPYIAPYDPAKINPIMRLKPPIWMEGSLPGHWLGTDNLGRDILSRLIYGSRVSLIVGLGAVIVSGVVGTILGLLAGFYGKWVNTIIMRIADAFHAIPSILLMLVMLAVVGPGIGTLIIVIGLTSWVSYTRVIRGEVLSLKERDYVKAARAVGSKNGRIIIKHILPNIISTFIVLSGMNVATTILMESSLSFLGLGIKPPDVSWGTMLSDGKQYIATSWWVATFPGVAITITVLGVIFLGDWLRDKLDPRMSSKD